ncbi:MAG TPA: hypothetical protein VIU15_40005, partial [Streptomyces sp.]
MRTPGVGRVRGDAEVLGDAREAGRVALADRAERPPRRHVGGDGGEGHVDDLVVADVLDGAVRALEVVV